MANQDCPAYNPTSISNLFPAWSSPQDLVHRWTCPNASWQSSPSRLTDLLTNLITEYFSDSNNFTNEELHNLIESQVPVVTSMAYVDEKNTGQLPKICIDFAGSALDENVSFGTDNELSYNIHNSTGTYYNAWNIQHQIAVIASTKRETLLLIEALCQLLVHYKSKIKQMLAVHNFKLTQITGAQVLGDNAENGFQASATTTIVAPDHWYLTEIAPRTKKIQSYIVEE